MDSPTSVVSSKFSHQYCSNGTVGEETAGPTEAKGGKLSVTLVSTAVAEARSHEESITSQRKFKM